MMYMAASSFTIILMTYQELSEYPIFIYSQTKDNILESKYTFPNILSSYTLEISNERLSPSGLTGSKIIGISAYQYKFSVHKTMFRNEYIYKPLYPKA